MKTLTILLFPLLLHASSHERAQKFFIDHYEAAEQLYFCDGIPIQLSLGVWALESGYGSSTAAQRNNLAGIASYKGGKHWKRFETKAEFYRAFAAIFQQPCYSNDLRPKTVDEYLEAMEWGCCSYHRSREYTHKIKWIIKNFKLDEMNGINVVSAFDGMSCGQIALELENIKVKNYFASEIKKSAIKVTQDNYPNTRQIGSIEFVTKSMLSNFKVDLLIGGSPCQDLTIINNKQAGLKGKKSRLFYEYLRLLKELKPKYFLLENVASMRNADREIITKELGVEPILINSSRVSAQHRRRYYWTNATNIEQPKDKGVLLSDIINHNANREESFSIKKKEFIKRTLHKMYIRIDGKKSLPITARGYRSWNTQFITMPNGELRDLTLSEYKQLQTIPVSYKMNVTKAKATDLIGDGWTIDVIRHFFKNMTF